MFMMMTMKNEDCRCLPKKEVSILHFAVRRITLNFYFDVWYFGSNVSYCLKTLVFMVGLMFFTFCWLDGYSDSKGNVCWITCCASDRSPFSYLFNG